MRKRLNGQWIFGLVLMLVVLLTACGQNVETKWQEQYDLGIKYLSEGNYEEAIIAFTEAIKVDPKQAPAYVKLSEAYKGQGNMDQAKKILEDGLTVCGENTELQVKLEALESLPQGDYGIYYTADLMKPQEMTIGGVPFWKTTASDIESLYPGGDIIPAGDIPVPQYRALVYGENGMEYGCCYAGYDVGTEKLTQVSYQSYLENNVRGFTTELRGICCGQDLSYVILTLGMTEQAVQEIENASNVYMSVNSNGVLSKFDCSGNDHDDHIRIDAYFDTEDFSIQLALTFEADILTAISYYLR